ncbi:hypothetical protein D3C81_10940 [compost metagenome]
MWDKKNVKIKGEETQVYLTATHKRSKDGKKSVKRKFALVIGGIALSVAIIGGLALGGFDKYTDASPTDNIPITDVADSYDSGTKVTDASALATNLKMATKMIKSAEAANQWDASFITKLCTRLSEIEDRLAEDSSIKDNIDLRDAIIEADKSITGVNFKEDTPNYQILQQKQKDATTILNRLKEQMDIAQTVEAPSNNEAQNESTVGIVDNNNSGGVQQGPPIYVGEPGGGTSAQPNQPSAPTQPSQPSAPVQQGINTIYGSHTYGTRNQSEYDAVMSKAKAAANRGINAPVIAYYERYVNGDRAENYAQGSDDYNNLLFVHKSWGYFLSKAPKDQAFKFLKVLQEATDLARSTNARNPYNGSPSSAYDVLFGGLTDCDANAQVKAAVLDSAGFSTSVRYSDGHAWLVVNINGTWWNTGGQPVGLTGNAVPNSAPN